MTWRERTVCVILLLVARIVAGDASLVLELRNLSNRISVHAGQQQLEVVD